MYFTVFSFVLLFSCQNNSKPPQKSSVIRVESKSQNKLHENDSKVYTSGSVDSLPKYPGGMDKFHVFLRKNYVVPKEGEEDEFLGRQFLLVLP